MRNAPDLRDVNGRYRTSQTGQRFRTDLRTNHLLGRDAITGKANMVIVHGNFLRKIGSVTTGSGSVRAVR
jgi:hypothetical protein